MSIHSLRRRLMAALAGLSVALFGSAALADPPSRIARLGHTSGEISFSPAGDDDWVQASLNRPLTSGDRLWSERGARAEIELGGAWVRMDADTGLSVLNLDDRVTQLQLTQGVLYLRLRRLDAGQVFEVDTPNLAFTLRQPGSYRIEVDPDGQATTIVVRQGQGQAHGEGRSRTIDARRGWRFTGTDLQDDARFNPPPQDEFDRWALARDRLHDNSASARFVSPDVVGYQDLDANGQWSVDPAYGNVWYPSHVAANWAPYRDGRWVWVDPWGWTWIDDAPWGFAVSHYGRWAHTRGRWGWVPGPVRSRAYYAPALVVFIGGDGFQLTLASGNVDGVAWFPLGPREVYRPAYASSRRYFEAINRSNTVVSNTVINNTYNTTQVTNIVYANRHVQGAVVAVPRAAFVQSHPVVRSAAVVPQELLGRQPVRVAAPVAPRPGSAQGGPKAAGKPPARVFDRPVLARTAPPAAPVGLAVQQPQLDTRPGQPLSEAARKRLTPRADAPAPAVKVVRPSAPEGQRQPPAAPAARPKAAEPRVQPAPEPRPQPATEPRRPVAPPRAPPPAAQAPTRAAPPAPAPRPAEGKAADRKRGADEPQRDNDRRNKPKKED